MDRRDKSKNNAIQHGCRAKSRLLPHESEQEYLALWATWLTRYTPTNPAEFELFRMLVDNAWRLRRSEQALLQVETRLYQEQPHAGLWTADQLKRLQLMRRYRTADENAFHKSLRLLEFLRKADFQNEVSAERTLQAAIEDVRQEPAYTDAKLELAKRIFRKPELPAVRHDGGCACSFCLLEWGLNEVEKNKDKHEL